MSNLYATTTMEGWQKEYEAAIDLVEENRFAPVEVSSPQGDTETLTAGRYLASVALARPYCQNGVAPSWETTLVRSPLDARTLHWHLESITRDLKAHQSHIDLSRNLSITVKDLAEIGTATTTWVGSSISIRDLLDTAEQDKEIEDLLFRWEIPEDADFHTIEKSLEDARGRLVDRILETRTDISRLVQSGGAVNIDQLGQALLCVGPKPNLMGQVIPEPISTSYLRGMRTVQDFYISAEAARKAQVMNYNLVRMSGYHSRKLVLVVMEHTLGNVQECDTTRGIYIKDLSEEGARRLAGRNVHRVVIGDGGEEKMEDDPITIDPSDTSSYVGGRYVLYSPMTCAAPDGVCRRCYGHLYDLNKEIHVGIMGVLYISEQLTQRLLSAKHMLKTKVKKIHWPEEFSRSFIVDKTAIIVDGEDLVAIGVSSEDLEKIDDEGDDQWTTTILLSEEGSKHTIPVHLPTPIHLQPEDWDNASLQKGVYWIKAETGSSPFFLMIENTELRDTLDRILRIVENEEHEDIDDYYAEFTGALEKGSISTPSVHAEMILRAMVRSEEDISRRPDFSKEDAEYQILKLPLAILTSPSLSNTLAFEHVRKQILSPTVFEKTDEGMLDPMFGSKGGE